MLRAALARVRDTFPRLLVFEVLFKLIVALLFAPLANLALGALLAHGGSPSVTNADIPTFLLSFAGLLTVLLGGSGFIASHLAEQAGLMMVLRDDRTGPGDAIRTLAAALPRLLVTAAAQLAWITLIVLPLIATAAVVYFTVLGEHDINWYLATHPPAFTRALWIVGGVAAPTVLVLVLVLVRWAFVAPVVVFEGRMGFAALARSRELMRGRARAVVVPLVGWVAVVALGGLGLTLLFGAGAGWLVDRLPSPGAQVVGVAALVGVFVVGLFLCSVVAAGGFAALVLRLYGGELVTATAAVRRRRLGWVVLALAAVATIALGLGVLGLVADGVGRSRDVLVTAHRGSSEAAPENSLAAIRLAMEEGADLCEIDIQEMADGTIVLSHDTDFQRVAGFPGKVGETTYDQVRDLDAGSWFDPKFASERIPTLEQVIDLVGDRMRLNIEFKYHGMERRFEERAIEIIRRKDFTKRCVITSLEARGLARVKALAPELVRGQIVTVAIGKVHEIDADFLSMSAAQATSAQVRRNRKAGLDTHVWTVNEADEMRQMIERGVASVITDVPALARQVLDERAGHSDLELLLLALGRQLRD